MNFEHPMTGSQLLTGGDEESSFLDESSVGIPDLVSSVELRLPDASPNLSIMSRFSSTPKGDGNSNNCEGEFDTISERFSSMVVILLFVLSNDDTVLELLKILSDSVSTSIVNVEPSTPGRPHKRGSSREELKMSTSASSPSLPVDRGGVFGRKCNLKHYSCISVSRLQSYTKTYENGQG
jgi:hypothetical protein